MYFAIIDKDRDARTDCYHFIAFAQPMPMDVYLRNKKKSVITIFVSDNYVHSCALRGWECVSGKIYVRMKEIVTIIKEEELPEIIENFE